MTIVLYFAIGAYVWPFALWVLLRGARRGLTWPAPVYGQAYLALSLALPLVAYRWVFDISLPVAFWHPVRLPGSPLELALGPFLALLPAAGCPVQAATAVVLAALLLASARDGASAEVARYHRLYAAGRWTHCRGWTPTARASSCPRTSRL